MAPRRPVVFRHRDLKYSEDHLQLDPRSSRLAEAARRTMLYLREHSPVSRVGAHCQKEPILDEQISRCLAI